MKPDIICVQETFFHDYNVFNIPNYTHVINNRGFEKRGGLAIYIHNSFTFRNVETPIVEEEYQKIDIVINNQIFTLINYYNPCKKINLVNLNKLLENCQQNMIIVGDFNSHSYRWGSSKNDYNGKEIIKFIDHNNLVLLNDGTPTRIDPHTGNHSNLDLSLASITLASKIEWQVLPVLFGSDHYVIQINIYINTNKKNNTKCHNPDTTWSSKNVNWDIYKKIISSEIHPINDSTVQEQYNILTGSIRNAADKTMSKSHKKKTHFNPIPWWSEECDRAIKERNRAKNRLNRNLILHDLIDFKKKKALAQKIIRNTKSQYMLKYCNTLNRTSTIGKVWKQVKNINQSGQNLNKFSNLIDPENKTSSITSPLDKANLIAKHFQSIDNRLNDQEKDKRQLYEKEVIDKEITKDDVPNFYINLINESFTRQELTAAINDMKDTAPGKDGIKKIMVQNLPEVATNFLLHIYNSIWERGTFPNQWYTTIQVPIPKKGKEPTDPASYRPISLTSIICKIMEKMIKKRITWYFEKENIFNPFQSGFRKNRSTKDQLIRLETDIHKGLINKEYTTTVFLDLEKAYDLLWKKGLIYKLHKIGFRGNILKWTRAFLENRQCIVRIDDTYSDPYIIKNGIPQGSSISPILFNIMLNDIDLKDPLVKISLFADDITVWYSHPHLQYAEKRIQRAINQLSTWCSKWGLYPSPTKSAVIVFTNRINSVTEIKIQDIVIKQLNEYCFLGVWLDHRLTWKKHINYITERCSKRLNLLRCISGTTWGNNSEMLYMVYKGLIRSIFDYGCELYDSACITLKKQVDTIQYKALKIITGALKLTSLDAMLVECGEMPLSLRRKKLLNNYFIYLNFCNDNHPTKEILITCWQFEQCQWKPGEGPFIKRIKANTSMKIEKWNSCQSKYPFWHLPTPRVSFIVHTKMNKKSNNHHDLKDCSLEVISTLYADHLQIYTDGSKQSDESTGAAFYIPELNIKKYAKISPISIARAELTAIILALEWLDNLISLNVVILSDSLSALQAISSYKYEQSLVLEILYLLKHLERKRIHVYFEWIPSHIGLHGNEIVDQLANKATKRKCIDFDIPKNRKEHEHDNKYECIQDWQRIWDISTNGRYLYVIQNKVNNFYFPKNLNRKDETTLHQFRLGKCPLNVYLHELKKHDDGKCSYCNVLETIHHYIFECKRYEQLRRPMVQGIKKPYHISELLNSENNIQALLTFVRKSKRFT